MILALVKAWLTGKLIDALLELSPHLSPAPAPFPSPVGPPRGAGARRPVRRVPIGPLPRETPPGTAATPATVRTSAPASTGPWPQVLPQDLPAFPGPGWVPADPPGSAVVERANALLIPLWSQTPAGRTRGFVRIEQTAGRWIAYQATLMPGNVKGVVAYRLREQGGSPMARPASTSPAVSVSPRVTTLPEVLVTASPPSQGSDTTFASDNRPVSTALPVLRQGSRGQDVQLLQRHLGVTPDGIFGPQTAGAVVAYQRAHGLTPDGIVGPKTWGSLLGAGQAA